MKLTNPKSLVRPPGGRAADITALYANDRDALTAFFSESPNFRSLLQRVDRLLRRLGIDYFNYRVLQGQSDGALHVGRMPTGFMANYNKNLWYRSDITIAHALLKNGSVTRRDIETHLLSAPFAHPLYVANRELLHLCERYGIREFCAFAITSVTQKRGLLWLGSASLSIDAFRDVIEHQSDWIQLLAEALDVVGHQRFASEMPSRRESPLSKGAQELLEVMASEDLTLADAAARLNRSLSTVNQQVATARKILGVKSTASAVIKAYKLGIIDL